MSIVTYSVEQQYGVGQVEHCAAIDLLSRLDRNSVGLLASDPPFFIGIRRDSGGRGFDPWVGQSVITIDDMINWYSPIAHHTFRVLRPGGACAIIGGSQSIAAWEVAACRAGLNWMADITILWNQGKPRARSFGSLTNTIRWYSKPGFRHEFNSSKHSIYSNVVVCRKVPIEDRVHPAQKPVELTNFIVSLLSNPNDLVVDPFAGSGSTLVSAAMCGRRFIGCDIDPDNVDIARRRTQQLELEEAELREIHLWINGNLVPVE